MEINNNMQLAIALNFLSREKNPCFINFLIRMITQYRGMPNAGYLQLVMERYKGRKSLSPQQLMFYDRVISEFEAHWFL